MAMNSRTLLVLTAIGIVLAAAIGDVVQGGTAFSLIVLAITLTVVVFIWFLFNGTKEADRNGSTAIKTMHSIGRGAESLDDHQEAPNNDLPDPLEAGIDMPLM
jgi:hypothetical protein